MTTTLPRSLWERYIMAVDAVTDRLERITRALEEAEVLYVVVGGQAVALWVSTKDPAAVRTTKNVDILLRKEDLPAARAAALNVNMGYVEILGVGMFLERGDPNPRHAVRILWASEKVRPENSLPAPPIDECLTLEPGKQVVTLRGLVQMKLVSNRDQDRVHLHDMIDVGLVGRDLLQELPQEPGDRLSGLLTQAGR